VGVMVAEEGNVKIKKFDGADLGRCK